MSEALSDAVSGECAYKVVVAAGWNEDEEEIGIGAADREGGGTCDAAG